MAAGCCQQGESTQTAGLRAPTLTLAPTPSFKTPTPTPTLSPTPTLTPAPTPTPTLALTLTLTPTLPLTLSLTTDPNPNQGGAEGEISGYEIFFWVWAIAREVGEVYELDEFSFGGVRM